MDRKGSAPQEYMRPLAMVLVIWALIQFDSAAGLIPNQIAALSITPAVWGIGAGLLSVRAKRDNRAYSLYRHSPFSGRGGLLLFFVITGGLTVAFSNYLYAGLRPLFVRELLTEYPLYTIRNILYYPLEVLLMLYLLMYSQAAGAIFTKKESIPWGALALFLLWGLPHILWHGLPDGIVSALRAFLYSIPFYSSGKNIGTSYICMVILWFL